MTSIALGTIQSRAIDVYGVSQCEAIDRIGVPQCEAIDRIGVPNSEAIDAKNVHSLAPTFELLNFKSIFQKSDEFFYTCTVLKGLQMLHISKVFNKWVSPFNMQLSCSERNGLVCEYF